MNTLRTFRWCHLLGKPETTYAYTWYQVDILLLPAVNYTATYVGGFSNTFVL